MTTGVAPKVQQLYDAFEKAAEDGDEEAAEFFAGEIKELQAQVDKTNEMSQGPGINEQARQAMASTKTDVGGAAGIPQPLIDFGSEATRHVFNAITPGEGMDKETFKDVDLGKGFVHLGRGMDNLVKGGKQIGIDMREGMGLISEEEADAERSEIHKQRLAEKEPYNILAGQNPGAAVLGNIVGETAPFVNLPVPRIAGSAAPVIGPLSRAAPEATAGALEAALPYVPEGESRTERAATGAAGATAGRFITDKLAQRANSAAGNMRTEELTDLEATGRANDVPINRGSPEKQLEAAEAAVGRRTGPDGRKRKIS